MLCYILLQTQCGHGFYQFSLELFFRLFAPDNGFELLRIYMTCNGRHYHVADPARVHGRVELLNSEGSLLMVHARKVAHVPDALKTPQQSDYLAVWTDHQTEKHDGRLKSFIQRIFSLYSHISHQTFENKKIRLLLLTGYDALMRDAPRPRTTKLRNGCSKAVARNKANDQTHKANDHKRQFHWFTLLAKYLTGRFGLAASTESKVQSRGCQSLDLDSGQMSGLRHLHVIQPTARWSRQRHSKKMTPRHLKVYARFIKSFARREGASSYIGTMDA
jgi:hypothetical protein